MRTPEFWYRPAGPLARALAPIGCLYGLGVRLRLAFGRFERVGVPVIRVGNLTAGGAGKTPIALSLVAALNERGFHPVILTRGHGGSIVGPHVVDPVRDDADAVGDEALLSARVAPCVVSRDRAGGARLAVERGADVIVMDDGHQNPALHVDMSIVVVDGAVGFGNERLVPAGPLREPVSRGLARADAVVVVGEDRTGLARRVGSKPLLVVRAKPDRRSDEWRGRRVLAFAGIGRPEKFFQTARETGADVVAVRPFPDHHRFGEREISVLLEEARALDATPVCTEKDAVRLPVDRRALFGVIGMTVEWDAPDAPDRLFGAVGLTRRGGV